METRESYSELELLLLVQSTSIGNFLEPVTTRNEKVNHIHMCDIYRDAKFLGKFKSGKFPPGILGILWEY